jgi:hypothetical protein
LSNPIFQAVGRAKIVNFALIKFLQMKFKVGDPVRFLNESGGGIISEIVDQNLVKVRIEDGFDIPVLTTELISDVPMDVNGQGSPLNAGSFVPFRKADNMVHDDIESILPENLPEGTAKNILLGFVPADRKNPGMSDIGLYLINDDDYAIAYHIGFRENVSWHFLKTGFLEPNTKLSIEAFNQSQISKIKAIHIQLFFIVKGRYNLQSPLEKFIGLDHVRFYKESTFKENSYFHGKAFIIKVSDNTDDIIDHLSEEEIERAIKEKETAEKKKQVLPSGTDEIVEVDLHIREIVDDFGRLSPGEILELQMNKFYTTLEDGLNRKISKLIFIHGVGNGKLKYEMIRALNEKYPDLTCQDASFKQYGYGATLVYMNRTAKKI